MNKLSSKIWAMLWILAFVGGCGDSGKEGASAPAQAQSPAPATTPAPPPTCTLDADLFPNCQLDSSLYRAIANNPDSDAAIKVRFGSSPTTSPPALMCGIDGPGPIYNRNNSSRNQSYLMDLQAIYRPTGNALGLSHSTIVAFGAGAGYLGFSAPQHQLTATETCPGLNCPSECSTQLHALPDDNLVGCTLRNRPLRTLMNTNSLRQPVAIARAASWWSGDAVVVFRDGLVTASGVATNTSLSVDDSGHEYVQGIRLPTNERPIAVTLSPENEFAFVLTWNTERLRSRVAVIAMAGAPSRTTPGIKGYENACWTRVNGNLQCNCDSAQCNPANYWAGDYTEPYPGTRNTGRFLTMRLMGFVDLPDSMRAATKLAAMTDYVPDHLATPLNLPVIGVTGDRRWVRWSNPVMWESWRPGGVNSFAFARAGYLVVMSRAERRVQFLDLAPLLNGLYKLYFDNLPGFIATRRGADANGLRELADNFPPTFDNSPNLAPRLVGEPIEFPDIPTVVQTAAIRILPSLPMPNCVTSRVAVVLIGTADGMLHLYDPGRLAGRLRISNEPGHADGDQCARADGAELPRSIATLAIGKNPVAIDRMLDNGIDIEPSADRPEVNFAVLSREERRIDWVGIRLSRVTMSQSSVQNMCPINSGRRGGVCVDHRAMSLDVVRTLRDGRMVDPLDLVDVVRNIDSSYVTAVADYGASKVRAYRYAPFHLSLGDSSGQGNGDFCGGAGQLACNLFPTCAGQQTATISDDFQHEGDLTLPGRPWMLSGANVN